MLELFERGIKEFTPLILRMMAQKVDAFEFDGNSPGDCGLMLKQIRQAGFKGKVIQIGGPGSDEIIEIAGPAAEGFLSYGVFDWDTPAGKKLRPIYETKVRQGHHQPVHAGLLPHHVPAGGRHQACRFHRHDKVRDALDAMNGFDAGVYGPVKWTGKEPTASTGS